MADYDWIKDLKVGDKVFVWNSNYCETLFVEKITPTGLIKVNGNLYNENGYLRGSDIWYRPQLIQWSQEKEDELRREKYIKAVVRKLTGLKDGDITYGQAVTIMSILKNNKVITDIV